MITKVYQKVGANITATIYQSEDKEKLILAPVSRDYNQSRKPSYYLKKGTPNKKPTYLSGLFPTTSPAVFSADVKDPFTGIKNHLKITFLHGGESLTIQGGKSW